MRNAGFHALSAVTKHLVTKKMNHSKLMKVMISYNPFQAKQIPLEEYNRLTVELNQLRFCHQLFITHPVSILNSNSVLSLPAGLLHFFLNVLSNAFILQFPRNITTGLVRSSMRLV